MYIENEVRRLVSNKSGYSLEAIARESDLREDLNLTDDELGELACEIEEELGVLVCMDAIDTVKDLIYAVAAD